MPNRTGEPLLVHATAVAFGSRGVLLRGLPGSGKSGLALMLIDGGGADLGAAMLVSDDQVMIVREGKSLVMTPPATIAGKFEIRGQGVVVMPFVTRIPLLLAVDLRPAVDIHRLPHPGDLSDRILGHTIPRIWVDASHPSAAARVRQALRIIAPGTKEA